MRIIHCLLGVLIFLLVTIGIFAVYGLWGWEASWDGLVLFLYDQRYVSIGGAVASLLLFMLFGLTKSRPKSDADYISYAADGGAVSISVKAVKEFIQKIGDEFAAILAIHPSLTVRGSGNLDIAIDVRVKAGTHVPELCTLLQDRVRESLRDSLGLASVKSIKVKVREIVGNASPEDSIAASKDTGIST